MPSWAASSSRAARWPASSRPRNLLASPSSSSSGPLSGGELSLPGIALFKWQRNRGQVELRVYEFEGKTDTPLDPQAPGVGRAKYDNFTVLILFGFTLRDVEQRE